MNPSFRAEITALARQHLTLHQPDHFDVKGHCQCGCKTCRGSEGKCLCPDCPCSRIGQCEGDGGCVKCRPGYSYVTP